MERDSEGREGLDNRFIPRSRLARVMRVFISSTFRDMQAERDELTKFIFPQLRKLCEQRGLTWGEVDLRWGITDEQTAEGRVLPVCLDEIQRCRPYFIGLLGERYGWVPDRIAPELIEREPWLAEQFDHSVTELEILHGVLNNPGMAEHAFFYFRDPKYLETLPPEERSLFLEGASPEEIEKHGKEEAQRRSAQRREKLAGLKERIRGSGFPWQEKYRDPQALGQMVLQDLTAIINKLYPQGSQPDPLDREAAEHEAFALSRAQVYIGRPSYFDRLDAQARAGGGALVVLGESGSGKSALLANWALRYSQEHEEELVLMHFLGATPGSADWMAMLRRIMGELKKRFGLDGEVPDQPEALRRAFANWLNMAAARGRVVLVLDALNQLEDRDGALDLVWLPPNIPEKVCLLLSTLPSRPLDELQKRGWPSLTIEPLQPEEGRQLIEEYLALFRKGLDQDRSERIAGAAQCRNPLFLRALLDELRLFGVHEELGDRIELYLKAPTIPALYELILDRCREDYERERPGLTGDAMSLLWAARRGLSEAELMELLGADGQPLPHAHWSPLHLALEQSLLSRGGLIGFFHDYLRQAVQNHYLPEESLQRSAHLRLAEYFAAQAEGSLRRLDELPWQLAQGKEWKRLYTLLEDLEFFRAAWELNPFEVKAYWAQVEANTPYRMVEAYRQVIDEPGQHQDHVWCISVLFGDTGHLEEALTLRAYLVGYYRKTGDKPNLGASLGNQAVVLYARGDLEGAMELYKEQERICRELGDKAGLGASLGNQGLILKDRGDLEGAMALYKEKESICRELGDKAGLGASLCNQGTIFYAHGDLEGAMALYKEQERICRELGDKAGLGASLGNQANILYDCGDLNGAMALYKEEEHICREMGNKAGLGRSLSHQASILYARGDLDGAMALYKEEEHICRELGDKAGLGASFNNQANILYDCGDLNGAMALYKEEERICREMGDKAGLGASFNNQAVILKTRGDLERAMALYKQQEHICRELGDKAGLQASLSNQANILRIRGDLKGAMALQKQAELICRELGDPQGLARSLINQALILAKMSNKGEAHRLAEESLRLAQENGYHSLAQQIKSLKDEM